MALLRSVILFIDRDGDAATCRTRMNFDLTALSVFTAFNMSRERAIAALPPPTRAPLPTPA